MSVKGKMKEAIKTPDHLPKNTLDHIMKSLEKEGKTLSEIDEDTIKGLEGKGIRLPLGRKETKIRQVPLELKGQTVSEIIIEDRR